MRKTQGLVFVTVFALFLAGVVSAETLTLPDGTLSVTGYDDHAYVISDLTMDAQNAGEVHVTGTITDASFAGINVAWFEVGLITDEERDRALDQYGQPAYMFNQSVFMLFFQGSGGILVAMSSDYAGDFPGGVGPSHGPLTPPFDFDLKLVPNAGGTGGMAYLSINGEPYDEGLPYGTDNWNWYGWNFPPEEFSQAYLIAQMYSVAGAGETSFVSFQNVRAENEIPSAVPDPALAPTTWGRLKKMYE
jgi:hypothetical protein